MPRANAAEKRRELGDFIRAQRERLGPEDFGLARAGRRRTPGLRREEAAQLCGLSVTWYTWLEQGRDVAVSAAAIARFARALRLSRTERAYVFELAGRRDPDQGDGEIEVITAAIEASLRAIASPAYILDRMWNARAWNAQASKLFVGWLDRPNVRPSGSASGRAGDRPDDDPNDNTSDNASDRNLLRFIFLEPAARSLICDYDNRARRVVAEFRVGASAHLADRPIRDLIAELRGRSPLFARLWNKHTVLGREGGVRTFNHPRDGFLSFEQVTYNLASNPDMKLTILVRAAAPRGNARL
jgi:transcriptional regulator with XRE-family HTH domain